MNSKRGDDRAPRTLFVEHDLMESDEPYGGPVRTTLKGGMLIGYRIYNPELLYRIRTLCHQSIHPDVFQKMKDIM